jgi:hypothetical protein
MGSGMFPLEAAWLLGCHQPNSTLVPSPHLGLGLFGLAVRTNEGFMEVFFCGHTNNRCRGTISLFLKIVSRRKEVVRLNSCF